MSIVLRARTPPLMSSMSGPKFEGKIDGQGYMLIGERYVHGMMSGEMIDKPHEIEELLIIWLAI